MWTSHQTTSASLGNLLEMKILNPHLSPTEAETWGMGPRNLDFNKSARRFWHMLKFKNTVLGFYCVCLTVLITIWHYISYFFADLLSPSPTRIKLSRRDLVTNVSPALRIVANTQQALKKDFEMSEWFAASGLAQPIKTRTQYGAQSVNPSSKFPPQVTWMGWQRPRRDLVRG